MTFEIATLRVLAATAADELCTPLDRAACVNRILRDLPAIFDELERLTKDPRYGADYWRGRVDAAGVVPTVPPAENCASCRYFRAEFKAGTQEPRPDGMGLCYLDPPQLGLFEDLWGKYRSLFKRPLVLATESCSHYEERS